MGFVCVSVHLLEFLKRVLLREEMDFLFIFGYAFAFVVIWALIKQLNKREHNSLFFFFFNELSIVKSTI